MTKPFERPDVFNKRVTKSFERFNVSNERVTKSFERTDVSNCVTGEEAIRTGCF